MKTTISIYLLFICSLCQAQNTFSLGAKIGYGTSAFPLNAEFETNGVPQLVKSGATLSTGIIGRYTIGDRMGIESGLSCNHYSFYYKDRFRKRDAFWKTAAEVEVVNYQMPILLNYKIKIDRHPYRYFIVGAGTSLDCFLPYWNTGRSSALIPASFQNLVASVKAGSERLKGNMMELGVEIQCAFKDFTIRSDGFPSPTRHRLSARTNMVSLNLVYFFLNRARTHTPL